MPDLELIGAPQSNYLRTLPQGAALLAEHAALAAYYERHAARRSVQETLPTPFPGRG